MPTNEVSNRTLGNSKDVAFTDPTVYSEYGGKWSSLPQDEAGWIQRAQEVADVLSVDAGTRDKENKSPRAEIALLKHAGLLKVLGPKKYGGGEQPWSVGYLLIRKVAEADGYAQLCPVARNYAYYILAPLVCYLDTICFGLRPRILSVR
jgi:hypothetical protein